MQNRCETISSINDGILNIDFTNNSNKIKFLRKGFKTATIIILKKIVRNEIKSQIRNNKCNNTCNNSNYILNMKIVNTKEID